MVGGKHEAKRLAVLASPHGDVCDNLRLQLVVERLLSAAAKWNDERSERADPAHVRLVTPPLSLRNDP